MSINKVFKIGDKVKVIAHHFNGINRTYYTGEIVVGMNPFYIIKKASGLKMRVHEKYLKRQSCLKNKLK